MREQAVATIKITNEVACICQGLTSEHNKYLHDKFGVFAEGYFFNPLFKMGRWDGKVHYYQMNGRTFIRLLDEILPIIDKFGYAINLVDQRKTVSLKPDHVKEDVFAHILHPDTGEPIILRDYQLESVNTAIDNGIGVVIAGTGAGKTIITAALVNAYGLKGAKTLTIVPDTGLIRQTKAQFIHCELDTGEYSGAKKTLQHQHIVSTWQALKNNPDIMDMFDVVLVDECHGAKGKTIQSLLLEHGGKIAHRFGVTGTLPKDPSDKMAIFTALGPVLFTISAKELMDKKVLADLHIDVVQLQEDLVGPYEEYLGEFKKSLNKSRPLTYTQFKDGYFPDFTAEKSYIYRNQSRIEWIAKFIYTKSEFKKGNVLCFVDSIPFGRKLAALIPNAIFVNGEDIKKAEDREKIYDMFKVNDNLVVIATVHIAGTGLSINRIFHLMSIDVGKSFIRVIQAIGRGLRKAHDKDSVSMTDICSDLKHAKKHLKMRTNYYDEAQYPYEKTKVAYKMNSDLVFLDDIDV